MVAFGPVVQLVRTPACHAGGRRFESVPGRQFRYADMAQAVERVLGKDEVGGSSPPISSSCAANAAQFFIFSDYIHKIPRRHGTYRPAGIFYILLNFTQANQPSRRIRQSRIFACCRRYIAQDTCRLFFPGNNMFPSLQASRL